MNAGAEPCNDAPTTMDHEPPVESVPGPGRPSLLRSLLGGLRLAYLPILMTYFCFGASAVTGVALVFFEKDALGLTPAEVAGIGFWLGLPWTMKMVVGVASDVHPIFGSRRGAYLLLGADRKSVV